MKKLIDNGNKRYAAS